MRTIYFYLMGISCLFVGCNLSTTAISPCVDGDIRGDTQCVDGQWMPIDIVDQSMMDMVLDMKDMSTLSDAAQDLSPVQDMVSDVPKGLDMAKDQGMDASCDIARICHEQNKRCGLVTDEMCGDIDCGECGMHGSCENNTCVCDVSTCGMRYCGQKSSSCGVLNCPSTCAWGQSCTNNECTPELIISPTPQPGNGFGHRIVHNSQWMAISAPFQKVGSYTNAGVVELFELVNNTWVHKKTIEGKRTNHYLGFSTSMSEVALVIGAPSSLPSNLASMYGGEVHVYAKTGSSWLERSTVTGPASVGFGMSLAIWKDSNMGSGIGFFVGAPFALHSSMPSSGFVESYNCFLGACQAGEKIWADLGESFGTSILAVDQYGVLVGQPKYSGDANESGRGLFYFSEGGARDLLHEFKPPAVPQQMFGRTMAVSESSFFVGAPHFRVGNRKVGRVYVFDDEFATPTVLQPSQNDAAEFGAALAVGEDYAFVGAPSADRVYIYNVVGGQVNTSTPTILEHPRQQTNTTFGASLSWQALRQTLYVGAPDEGRVYIYHQ